MSMYLAEITCNSSAHQKGLKYDLGVYDDQLGGFVTCPECGQANRVPDEGLKKAVGLCTLDNKPIDDHWLFKEGDHFVAVCRK